MQKMLIVLAVAALLGAPGPAVAVPFTTEAVAPPSVPKDPGAAPAAPLPGVQQGGDTFGSATVIPSLPYSDTGTSCGFADDYDPSCSLYDPLAADVVYAFTPPADVCVDVSLCGSGYDTVVYIVNSANWTVARCNDDACGSQSEMNTVHLSGGVLYYIVVDGYGSACGDYILTVSECPPPCVPACPPGAVVEHEPDCADGYADATNGGCNSTPVLVHDLACNDAGVAVCGRYGTFVGTNGFGTRDTDWYRIQIDHPVTLTVCGCAEGHFQVLIIDANHGCPVMSPDILAGASTLAASDAICVSASVAAGAYFLWAGAADFGGVACGSNYVLTVSGYECQPVGVEPAQWSTVKARYR